VADVDPQMQGVWARSAVDFTGDYRHAVDPKGRLVLPAKHRDRLQLGGYLTRFPGPCLAVFTGAEYEIVVSRLREQARNGELSIQTIRQVASSTVEVKPDAQGRVLIPENLRSWAGIESDVVVAGMFNHIEIWPASKWDTDLSGDEVAAEEAVARAAF
jgi:MraZ protein